MKTLKIFLIFVFALFLIGSVNAFGYINGAFDDGSVDGTQSISINEGDSVIFNYDFWSDTSSLKVYINLYDSQGNVIVPFVNSEISKDELFYDSNAGYYDYTGEKNIPSNLKAGSYELIMSANNIENPKILYLKVNSIQDTNPPVITLLGDNPVTVVQGTNYVDAGATAWDKEDGDLTSKIIISNPVNVNVVGTYTINYDVQDSAGNHAKQVTRTVNVIPSTPSDTTPPVIIIITPQEKTYNNQNMVFEVKTDEHAVVRCILDNSYEIIMNEKSTNDFVSALLALPEGNHVVVFGATDDSGNFATKTVHFAVDLSGQFPTINVITPEQGKEYSQSHLTFKVLINEASDVSFDLDNQGKRIMSYQGILNGMLVFTYDISLSDGNHEVIFYATNRAGNTASKVVSFSVNTCNNNNNNNNTHQENNYGSNSYYDDSYGEFLYYNQFAKPKIVYIEKETPKHLSFWQRLIAWLKRFFGFE